MNIWQHNNVTQFIVKTVTIPDSEKYQVTVWSPSEEIMEDTQWGTVRYDHWLQLEVGRAAEQRLNFWIE